MNKFDLNCCIVRSRSQWHQREIKCCLWPFDAEMQYDIDCTLLREERMICHAVYACDRVQWTFTGLLCKSCVFVFPQNISTQHVSSSWLIASYLAWPISHRRRLFITNFLPWLQQKSALTRVQKPRLTVFVPRDLDLWLLTLNKWFPRLMVEHFYVKFAVGDHSCIGVWDIVWNNRQTVRQTDRQTDRQTPLKTLPHDYRRHG